MQKCWIELNFEKRECNKYVPSKETGKCGCGQAAPAHPVSQPSLVVPSVFSDDSSQTSTEDHWSPLRHTSSSPTDAFGTIEFQGTPHPLKAKYVRLSFDTKEELVLQLLLKEWHLELPKLLITVHGGKANFELQPKLKSVLCKGLLKAAKTTGAWIFTAGTNTGVMRHVGEALLNERTARHRSRAVAIGIAPWGIIQNHKELIGKNVVVPYHSISSPKSRFAVLNNNHSYFILVDNGTVGKYGGEIALRKKLEKHISKQKIYAKSDMESCGVPVVCVVVEGGLNTIRNVLECVTDTPPVPVVVCDGSGRAADLIAFAHKYLQDDDDSVLESVREQLLSTIEVTFKLSREQAENLHEELVQCVRRKDLVTVFRMGEGPCQELDEAILIALLKGHHLPPTDQLQLALTWNRVDIARKEIFVYGQEWPAGALQQAMMDSLILDRVDFVKLLIEHGVCMQDFLTIPHLEELYNTRLGPSNILRRLVRDTRKHMSRGYRITLYDVGLVIDKLLGGGYRSSYCRRKFRLLYNNVMRRVLTSPTFNSLLGPEAISAKLSYYSSTPFKYPFNELLVWAVLTNRQKMALFMWQSGEEAIVKALVAYTLYKGMAREAAADDMEADLFEEMRENAVEFEKLALDLLDYCYRQDDNLTLQLLTYELQNWSKQTCLELAVMAKHSAFLAHTASQMLLADLWMGGLRTRKHSDLKVIVGLLFPPAIFNLEFKSTEELKLMPQTEEEHIWDMQAGDEDDRANEGSETATPDGTFHCHDKTLRKQSYAILHASGMSSSSKMENGKLLQSDSGPEMELSMDEANKPKPLRLGKKIYEFYAAPITKFWGHTMAYGAFLILFTYVVLVQMTMEPSWHELFVILYLGTLGIEKLREIVCSQPVNVNQKILVWMEKKWNPCDLAVILFFFVGLILRLEESTHKVGRIIYCVDIMYWYIRTLDIVSVNKYLGPYVTMIGKMVLDMIYFVVLLLIVLMSYGVARQALLYPSEKPSWHLARNVFYMPYFMLYGEVFADSIDPECGNCIVKSESGECTAKSECVTGQWINPVIMSIYLLIANVLLLNLLIAVFNNIFVEVNAISQQVWKSQRFRVVMEYEQKPIIPPPLIILSHLYLLAKYCYNYWKGKGEFYAGGLKLFLDETSVEKINDFEEECVDSFFRDKEALITPDQHLSCLLERVESMTQKIEDINQRQKEANNWIQKLDFEFHNMEETYSALLMQDDAAERTSLSLREDSTKGHLENEDIPIDVQDEDTAVHLQVDKHRDSSDYSSGRKISNSSKVSFKCEGDGRRPPASPKISISCSDRTDNQALDDTSGNHISLFQRRLHRSRSPFLIRQQTIMIPDNIEQQMEGNYSAGISQGKNPPLRRSSVSQIEDEHRPRASSAPNYRKVGRSLSLHSNSPWFKLDVPARIAPSSPRPPMLGATRGEYTSITDDLENVASLSHHMHMQYHHMTSSRSNSNEPKDEIETETLYDAEETDYHLMENLIQRRLHRNSENLAASLEELCIVHSDVDTNSDDDSVIEGNELEALCPQSITIQAHSDDSHLQFWSETRC